MCSRYTLTASRKALEERFRVAAPPGYHPRFNAAPSQELPVLIATPAPRLALLRFGLLPSWAKDGKAQINARAETVSDKPFFRDAFRWRRCLIPADGWFEWPKRGEKLPRHFRLKDAGLFSFAGLWEPGGFAIVTVPANPLVAAVHDRMPVVLARDAEPAWMDPKADAARLKELLLPFPSAQLEARAVSPRVGATDVDEPSLLDSPSSGQGELF